MQDVQFKGASPALTALIANEVPLAIFSVEAIRTARARIATA